MRFVGVWNYFNLYLLLARGHVSFNMLYNSIWSKLFYFRITELKSKLNRNELLRRNSSCAVFRKHFNINCGHLDSFHYPLPQFLSEVGVASEHAEKKHWVLLFKKYVPCWVIYSTIRTNTQLISKGMCRQVRRLNFLISHLHQDGNLYCLKQETKPFSTINPNVTWDE